MQDRPDLFWEYELKSKQQTRGNRLSVVGSLLPVVGLSRICSCLGVLYRRKRQVAVFSTWRLLASLEWFPCMPYIQASTEGVSCD